MLRTDAQSHSRASVDDRQHPGDLWLVDGEVRAGRSQDTLSVQYVGDLLRLHYLRLYTPVIHAQQPTRAVTNSTHLLCRTERSATWFRKDCWGQHTDETSG